MSFVRKGITNVFAYSCGLIIVNGLTFLMLPFYTRHFLPSEYALITIVLTTLPITRYCLPLEMCQAAPMFSSDKKSRSILYVSVGFWFTVFMNMSCYTLLCISNLIFHFFDYSFLNLASIFILFFSDCLFYYSSNILRWQIKPLPYNFITGGVAILEAIIAVILLLIFKFSVMGVIYAWAFSRTIGFLLTYFYTKEYYAFYFNLSILKRMLKFSLPLVISNIPYNLNRSLDRWIIVKYIGLSAVGIYGAGSSIAGIINFIMASISTALSPLIYKNHEKENSPQEIVKLFYIVIFFCVSIAIIFAAFDKEISLLLISKEYYIKFNNKPVVPMFVLSSIFAGIFIFFPGLHIKKKTIHIVWFNIISLLINIILSFALIFNFGIFGVAMATCVSIFSNTILYAFFSQKYYPLPFESKRVMSQIACFLILYLGAIGLGMKIDHFTLENFAIRLIYCLFSISLFGWLILRFSTWLPEFIGLESAANT